MTLLDVKRFSEYANKNLPLRVLVTYCAMALGIKLPEPKPDQSKYMSREQFRALVQATGGRMPGVGSV